MVTGIVVCGWDPTFPIYSWLFSSSPTHSRTVRSIYWTVGFRSQFEWTMAIPRFTHTTPHRTTTRSPTFPCPTRFAPVGYASGHYSPPGPVPTGVYPSPQFVPTLPLQCPVHCWFPTTIPLFGQPHSWLVNSQFCGSHGGSPART